MKSEELYTFFATLSVKNPLLPVAIRPQKPPYIKILLDPKNIGPFFVCFQSLFLLKQSCLHLVCYAAVFCFSSR